MKNVNSHGHCNCNYSGTPLAFCFLMHRLIYPRGNVYIKINTVSMSYLNTFNDQIKNTTHRLTRGTKIDNQIAVT